MDKINCERISSGIAGIDEILNGGLVPCKTYLVSGNTGTGKTNLGNMFLYAGAQKGECVLFLTLQENVAELQENAHRISIDTSGFTYLDLSQASDHPFEASKTNAFKPPEDIFEYIIKQVILKVEDIKPSRILIDSATQLRYMAPDPFQFRMRITGLFRFLVEHNCTVMAISEKNSRLISDDELKPAFDGVFLLEHNRWNRKIIIEKFRGSDFKEGEHSFQITNSGVNVFPYLLPGVGKQIFNPELISSGVDEIDRLVNGGIESGTITLISGPSGVGKTTLGLQFLQNAAKNNLKTFLYSFEEETSSILYRCKAIGMPLDEEIRNGTFNIQRIESLQYTNDEFSSIVKDNILRDNAKVIMIDPMASLETTYGAGEFSKNIHAISKYAQNRGATVFVIAETANIIENLKVTEAGISYLSDNIIFMRYLEIRGEMRKAIGVLKKRLSNFEKTLREFEITSEGIKVGKPFTNLRGILMGTPEILRPEEDEMDRQNVRKRRDELH
jgi:circadian clock protein KaiC